ncbi:MAG: DUF4352 domain-containing protein, partial [Thermomicrobiales bacterium]
MRKLLAVFMLMTMVGSLSLPTAASAQTPDTEAGIGQPVPIYSVDGNQIGTLTINAILDPFEDYDQSYSPQRGYHFVALDVTIANTSQRAFSADPYSLQVVDAEGFISNSTFVTPAETFTTPALEYTDALAPGTDMSGMVFFEVFSGSSLSRVLYAPSFEILTTVADFRSEQTAAGTPVSVIGTSGSEIAQVTVHGVSDPFDAYDEFSAPPRGSRYVAFDVSVVNTGERVLSTSPTSFVATDDIGFKIEAPYVTSTDSGLVNFDYIDLAPGEEQRGVVYFQVLEGIPVVQLLYGDGYETSLVIADLALGAPPITAQPTTVPVASSPDCEGLVPWGQDLVARLNAAGALTSSFEDVEAADLDPVAIRESSAQLEVLAQETRDSNPPPAAVELNTFFAEEFYAVLADATSQIADSLESG